MNLFTLFTLIFAFLSIISTVARASEPVKDWNGDPVKVGVAYDAWGVGQKRGPIAMGTTTEQSRNINYVINKPDQNPPLLPDPIFFNPADKSETLVRIGQDYNIIFQDDSKYPFNVWRVNDDRASNDRNFITTGGQKDNPGCWNIYSWFQFVLVNDTEHLYNLISNPQVCIHSRDPAEVTSIWKDGEDRLYLNEGNTVQNSAVNVRVGPHQTVIRQVVETNSWS